MKPGLGCNQPMKQKNEKSTNIKMNQPLQLHQQWFSLIQLVRLHFLAFCWATYWISSTEQRLHISSRRALQRLVFGRSNSPDFDELVVGRDDFFSAVKLALALQQVLVGAKQKKKNLPHVSARRNV